MSGELRSTPWGLLVGIVLPLVVVTTCGYRLLQARADLQNARATNREASLVAAEIRALRKKPSRVLQESRSDRALSRTIEQSAKGAGIDAAQITLIEPQAPRRVGESPYAEHATTVQLAGVTLPQLAGLARLLGDQEVGNEGLRITTLRVGTPYDKAAAEGRGELWNVELTLTYLVYSPTSTARTAG